MHLIQKRPSRPKYPSKRKHGNIPSAASDYRLSNIGRHRSLIDLLVDLAFVYNNMTNARTQVCVEGSIKLF